MLKRRQQSAADLPRAVLSLLAVGWGDFVPQIDDQDPFLVWALSDDELAALYRQHAKIVEAEALRHGRTRSWAAEKFTPGNDGDSKRWS